MPRLAFEHLTERVVILTALLVNHDDALMARLGAEARAIGIADGSTDSVSRLIVPVVLLIACAAVYQSWEPLAASLGIATGTTWGIPLRQASAVAFWCLAALIANRLLHILVWQGWFRLRSGVPVPKLLPDLAGVLIWLAAFFAMLALAFGIDVSGLVTTSGVAIAIIGFALRNMIADVFTGIALGIEQPLRIGDWIELEDGTVGRVAEINWRATRLVTKAELTKVVPNSYLATHPFTNYHAPDEYFCDKLEIVLDYDVTAHQAERILLSAVSQILESTRIPRKPDVRIVEYTERGPKWQLHYWVSDYVSLSNVRYRVQRNVLRNLHYAGVRVPRERVEYLDLAHPIAQRDRVSEDVGFLRSIELFDSLDTQELSSLREKMLRRLCLAGEPVVTEGEESGKSLFIVKEGFLDVTILDPEHNPVSVGWLAPGMCFGEMSLLTGVPRSATVTPSVDAVLFEITQEDIVPLLRGREDLVRRLSEVLADRQMRNDESLKAATAEKVEVHRQRLSARILSNIVSFFDLAGPARGKVRSIAP